jgi:hexosaminidase
LVTLAALVLLHLVPRPASVERLSCRISAATLRTVAPQFDPGARDELNERWTGLGLRPLATSAAPAIVVRHDPKLGAQAYRLIVRDGGAVIESGDADGAFYGAMTLAQLAVRDGSVPALPCVRIEDRPALRWRVLSDDVSRGPLPTMRYFKERIRTIAAFKMNGYSPYMEHVFVSPTDPLPAPLDGITPAQLHDLTIYARRFHVALIPQQQTLAHMHGTLRVERYAAAAANPHGFLIAPGSSGGQAYLARVIAQELAASGRPPYFHIASDEANVSKTDFAAHVAAMNRLIAPSGARLMLWDDALENDPGLARLLPRNAVIVNWHYLPEPSFRHYIDLVARGGFEQMVDPGDANWNEVFPDVAGALATENRFIGEGKASHVLGLFESVWHDDGETLYEATWYPVLYAAASAWEFGAVDPRGFERDFPGAFFGTEDARYGRDVVRLGEILQRLGAAAYANPSDVLFWDDPFDATANARMDSVDLRAVRLDAEGVEEHLYGARPPLHANAAFVMFLAARRYDALARKFQIASEVRDMYAEAVAHAADERGPALRDLLWCKYWMWELRDSYEELAPLYARAWRYESRDGHLASNLERYHLAAQRAIGLADAFHRATYDDYVPRKTLPPLSTVVAP